MNAQQFQTFNEIAAKELQNTIYDEAKSEDGLYEHSKSYKLNETYTFVSRTQLRTHVQLHFLRISFRKRTVRFQVGKCLVQLRIFCLIVNRAGSHRPNRSIVSGACSVSIVLLLFVDVFFFILVSSQVFHFAPGNWCVVT